MALPHLRPIALSLLVAFSTAHADETTLSAVNVTAKGYGATDLDTPISTTALDREEIARRGGQNLGDALRGELQPALTDDVPLQIRTAHGLVSVPREQLVLLRLLLLRQIK